MDAVSRTTRAGCCTSWTRATRPSVYLDFGGGVSTHGLQPAGKRVHRFTFHPEFARNGLFYTVHAERAPGNPAVPNFIPPGFTVGRRDVPQRHHRVARDESCRARLSRHQARAPPRSPRRLEPDASDRRRGVQPDREAWRRRLRPALHQRKRSRLQQRRRPEREQPGVQTQRLDSIITAILRIDPRSPSTTRGVKGLGDYTDPDGQQVRRRWRSENARRDLRLRLPERPPPVLGPDRWDDVRLRHRHGQHRGNQHRPQRRELRLDAARGNLGERPVARRAT